MSLIYLEVVVRCDRDGCTNEVFAHSPKEAYEDAQDEGWQLATATACEDLCPAHRS